MLTFVRAFWQIALFRQGPQSLPDSQLLLLLSGALYLVFGWPVAIESPVALLLDTGLLIAWCFALLGFYGLTRRWRQTLTAMLGTGVIFNACTVAVIVAIDWGLPVAVWTSALVMVLLWAVAVHGYILSQALSKSFGFGIALAVVYFVLSGLIAQNTSVQSEPNTTGVESPAD